MPFLLLFVLIIVPLFSGCSGKERVKTEPLSFDAAMIGSVLSSAKKFLEKERFFVKESLSRKSLVAKSYHDSSHWNEEIVVIVSTVPSLKPNKVTLRIETLSEPRDEWDDDSGSVVSHSPIGEKLIHHLKQELSRKIK